MSRKTVEIINATGLHARPASLFAKLAGSMKCGVFLEKEGKKINAKSILGVLSLGVGKGSVIDVITDGEDEDASLVKLVEFLENLEE